MKTRVNRALALAFALTLGGTAAALASGPYRGRTYEGGAPTSGVRYEHRHIVRLHAGGNIILRVAGNGRTVTVGFSSSSPILYCNISKSLRVQSTRPASLSGSGSFKASVSQKFLPGPGLAPITQVLYGRFSGGYVYGTIITEAGECSGSTSFAARAR